MALGGFRFDADSPPSPLWRGFPDGSLMIPNVTIQRKADQWRLIVADLVSPCVDPAIRAAFCFLFAQVLAAQKHYLFQSTAEQLQPMSLWA